MRSRSERIYAFNLRKFKIKIIRALRHYNSPPRLHSVSSRVLLWYPKKSSRCSLARFLRPLRQLTLPSSATGGGRVPCPLSTLERSGVRLLFCSWKVYGLIELCISKSLIKNWFFDKLNMKEKICGHFDLSSVERGTVFGIVSVIFISPSE